MTIKSGVATLILISMIVIGCSTEKERNPVLNIEPGQYEATVVRDNFDDREPRTTVVERCVPAEEYQPFREYYESEFCTVSNFKRTGESVEYDLDCDKDMEGGMKGTVSYSYSDGILKWSNYFIGANGERVYSFKVDGEARRLGECEKKVVEEKIKPF